MGQYLDIARTVRSRQVARELNESGDQEIRETPQEGAAPGREKPQAEPVGGDLGQPVALDPQAIRNERSAAPEMSQTADEEVSDRVGEIGRYMHRNRDKLDNPDQAAWEDPEDLIEFGFFDDLGFSPTEEEIREGQYALLMKDAERIRALPTETGSDSHSRTRVDDAGKAQDLSTRRSEIDVGDVNGEVSGLVREEQPDLENIPGDDAEDEKQFDQQRIEQIMDVLRQCQEYEYGDAQKLIDQDTFYELDFKPSREEVEKAYMRILFGPD